MPYNHKVTETKHVLPFIINYNVCDLSIFPTLTDYGRFQVNKHGTGHVFAGSGLAEEGVERVVAATDGFVSGHLTVRLDAMLETVQFPAGITDLDSGLANVYRDALTLLTKKK